MFEKLKLWLFGPDEEHPLVLLLRKQEQWDDLAKSKVPRACCTCEFYENPAAACRRFPTKIDVDAGHWCGEYRMSDASVREQLSEQDR